MNGVGGGGGGGFDDSVTGDATKTASTGMGLHDPLSLEGKLAPKSSQLARGLVKVVPGRGFFLCPPPP